MSPNRNRWSVVFFASLFLFAQIAVAAQGCLLVLDRAPDRHGAAAVAEHCDSLPTASGVCMMHCLWDDQTASAPDQHLTAAASSTTATRLDFLLVATRSPLHALCDSRWHVPRSPQVLFCSYQT